MSFQESLNEVVNWCESNSMIIRPAKTSVVIATCLKYQQSPLQLKLTLQKTNQVHEHHVFGVTIDVEM